MPDAQARMLGLLYGEPPKPACPKHGVMMRVESTRAEVRYLYCPVPGCRESACQQRHRVSPSR